MGFPTSGKTSVDFLRNISPTPASLCQPTTLTNQEGDGENNHGEIWGFKVSRLAHSRNILSATICQEDRFIMKRNELHTSESEIRAVCVCVHVCTCAFDQTFLMKVEPGVKRATHSPWSTFFLLQSHWWQQCVLHADVHKTSHETPWDPS